MSTLAIWALTLLCIAAEGAALGAETWNRFRGGNGSGVALEQAPPVLIRSNHVAWRMPVPEGLSSPVVARDKIFLTGLQDRQLVTLALDASTGRTVWRRAAPAEAIEKVHEFNTPATPTPCTDDERVYVYFGSYGLLCYDLEGTVLWQKPIPTPKNLYGTASSPILHRDLLILTLDDDANLADSRLSQSRIIALRKTSGETAWETPRPLHRSGWSTPVIWTHADAQELVVLGSGRLCGYDPATGVERWSVRGFARETTVVPVIGRDLVFASTAMGGIADENPDYEPLWKAMLHFDRNGDGKIAREEMTEHFTFPLRPEVPPTHPGFGIPVPADPVRRAERQTSIFAGIDKDRDGIWTRDEFVGNLGPRPFKPRLVAVRAGGAGDVTDTHVAWELKRCIPEIPSPLFYKGRLYLVRNGGLLTAVDPADGRIVFDERLGASGQYSASPVAANNHLYLLSNEGILSVVTAGDRFERVHQYALEEPAFVTPAIASDSLLIRTKSHLIALRAQPSGSGQK